MVVTATESLQKIKGWSDAQDRLATLSTNSQHRVVDATHAGLVDDEASHVPSARAIADVVRSTRADEPMALGST